LEGQKNVLDFLEYCKTQLDINKMEDWYKISRRQIKELGGKGLFSVYENLGKALSFAYPQEKWVMGRFIQCAHNVWRDQKNVRDFFDFCEKELYIECKEDWYRVSLVQISILGGVARYFGGLGKALKIAYPDYPWNLSRFLSSEKGRKISQRWLKVLLSKLLPEGTLIIENFHHPLLFWEENTTHKIEFDIWVPQYNLALEYQGEHHFHDLYGLGGGTIALHNERDSFKKTSACTHGICFLTIPYWWDGTISSLAATLHLHFPLLFPLSQGSPISTEIPINKVR